MSGGGENINRAYDSTGDLETSFSGNGNGVSNDDHRTVRPSVVSAFGHDTLDRVPNIDFYRNPGSVSGHRAVRPSLQEIHDVFQKVSLFVCERQGLTQSETDALQGSSEGFIHLSPLLCLEKVCMPPSVLTGILGLFRRKLVFTLAFAACTSLGLWILPWMQCFTSTI